MSKKNVSLLVSAAGWIAGLVEKIVSALRERGLTDEEIHALVNENGNALIGKIADGVTEFVKQTKKIVYAISVDYAMSAEEMIRLGKYDVVINSEIITTEHFQTKRTGKAEIEIELIHFGRSISSEEALKEMEKMGYRAAELHELLAFGEKYPSIQLELPIIALGSIWNCSYSRLGPVFSRVVFLGKCYSGRALSVSQFDGVRECRFAVVQK